MEAIKKSLLIVILLVGLFSFYKVSAQTTIFNIPFAPAHDEIWSGQNLEEITGGTSSRDYLMGFGTNNIFNGTTKVPNFMIDAYCDPSAAAFPNPTLLDINVNCPNCTPNAVPAKLHFVGK